MRLKYWTYSLISNVAEIYVGKKSDTNINHFFGFEFSARRQFGTMTWQQLPDENNNLYSATKGQPYDVVKSKMVACGLFKTENGRYL